MIWKTGLGVTQGDRKRHVSIRHLWFPISNLVRLVRFRDKRRFQSKFAKKIPTPVYFATLLKGFPLELGTDARDKKKLEWRGYRAEPRKKFDDIFSLLESGYNTPTWQTDGQTNRRTDGRTETGRQQWPRLRIASRSTNYGSLSWPCFIIDIVKLPGCFLTLANIKTLSSLTSSGIFSSEVSINVVKWAFQLVLSTGLSTGNRAQDMV